MNTNRFASAGYKIFIAVTALVPFFFIPWSGVTVDLAKVIVVSIGVSLSLLLLSWSFFRSKTLPIPNALVVWVSAGILLNMAVSTAISSSWYRSLIAQGIETTSLAFVFLCIAALYIASITLSNTKRVGSFVGALIIGYSLSSLVSIIRLFVAQDTFTLGVLSVKASSLFGSWYDLALWSAFIVIIAGWALMHKALPKVHKLIWIVYVVALVWLILVNAFPAWIAVLASAVLYIVIELKNRSFASNFKKALFPLYVPVVLAIVFLIFGQTITNGIYGVLKISGSGLEFNRIALSLPLKESLITASEVVSNNPLFGANPARFPYAYLQYKPSSVNLSDSWSIEFSSAYGYILNSVIEQGIVGSVLWLIFIVGMLVLIVKALSGAHNEENVFNAFSLRASALVSIAGLVILATFMPAQSTMFAIFASFGWLVASLAITGKLKISSPKSETKAKIIAVIFMVIALASLVLYVRKMASAYYFQVAKKAFTNSVPDIERAHEAFRMVTKIESFDINYQALAQLAIYSANNKLSKMQSMQNSKDPGTKDAQAELLKAVQDDISESISTARLAIDSDPKNYYNYITEARVSSALINIQVQNAKENAIQAYVKALELNPRGPNLLLEISQLAYDIGDYTAAVNYLTTALGQRPNYIDAVFLLTQTQIKQGKISDAITSAITARDISPKEPILHLQLGLLRYYNKEYGLAVESLQKAIALVPDYSNAHYFLGLSYSKLGRVADAIKEFEIVEGYNKDNEEIQSILKNLRSGKPPFPNGNRFDNVFTNAGGQTVKPPVAEKSR